MIPDAEIDAGTLAYEQVAAFAALRRKRLGLIYVLFPILLVVMGVAAGLNGVMSLGLVCVGSALLSAFFATWNWRRLHAQDEHNRALLARLRTQYGDGLPWLQVERQMAEIRRIQAEEAQGRAPLGDA
jgi:fatty acid desaturase